MVRKAEFECPCCGGLVRAWYQSSTTTVTCPTCRSEIGIPESGPREIGQRRQADVLETVRLLLHGLLSRHPLGRRFAQDADAPDWHPAM